MLAAARRSRNDLADRLRDGRVAWSGLGACPRVFEGSVEFHARVAEDTALLPEDAATAEMLSGSPVTRGVDAGARKAADVTPWDDHAQGSRSE